MMNDFQFRVCRNVERYTIYNAIYIFVDAAEKGTALKSWLCQMSARDHYKIGFIVIYI